LTIIIPANSAADTGYEVANSCRFDTAGTTYMTKAAFSNTGTNAFKFTFSCWIKRANLGVNQRILTAGDSTRDGFTFNTSDQLQFFAGSNSSEVNPFVTNRRFRDPSAWMHLVIACDSELTGATNQTKLYVNGTLETSFSATAAVDDENTWHIGNAKIHRIGTDSDSSLDYYLDGYLAEVVLIDGQQLTASSFGEFDEDSPTIWKPKDVSGLTFGTNGFYLDFEDSGDLGDDESGNTHDFTETNLAATDQATDTPTNNFCTMNPLENWTANNTFSEGNCVVSGGATSWQLSSGTMGFSKGKWFWEVRYEGGTITDYHAGVRDITANAFTTHSQAGCTTLYNGDGGEIFTGSDSNFTTADYGDINDSSDVLGIACNFDDGQISYYKNGSIIVTNHALDSTTNNKNTLFPLAVQYGASQVSKYNFGGCSGFTVSSGNADANGYGNFEYAVPSGYYSLCTKNLAEFG